VTFSIKNSSCLQSPSPDYVVQAMSMVESPNMESKLCRIEIFQFSSPDFVVQAMSNEKSQQYVELSSPGYCCPGYGMASMDNIDCDDNIADGYNFFHTQTAVHPCILICLVKKKVFKKYADM
jgi:hypothetical protein